MSYSIEIIQKNQQSTSAWSGGTTTQIAIYPKAAVYNERNFIWRLSSAKVELEESVFTSLPGIQRLIMVLSGEMRLEHEGHHSVDLKQFEQDRFSGDWVTRSFGKVQDFNLMMAQGCHGEIAIHTISRMPLSIPVISDAKTNIHNMTTALYCVDGQVCIHINPEVRYELHQGDLLLVNVENQNEVLNLTVNQTGATAVHLVQADIFY